MLNSFLEFHRSFLSMNRYKYNISINFEEALFLRYFVLFLTYEVCKGSLSYTLRTNRVLLVFNSFQKNAIPLEIIMLRVISFV